MQLISQSIPKLEGMELSLGKPMYVEDLSERGALCVKLLRSPHAFARIRSIDVEKARQLDGVACVLTYEDVPHTRYSAAAEALPQASPYDRLILENIVRYIGDPVAIVAARTEKIARAAMKRIRVDYEVLEPILDPEQAENNPTVIHPEGDDHVDFDSGFAPERNVVCEDAEEIGDFSAASKASAVTVGGRYHMQAQAHAMMETHRAFTYLDKRGRLVIVGSIQSAFHNQRIDAKALNIPQNRIHVIKPRIGGGFGGKNLALVDVFPALVTLKTGKPALLVLDRKECFEATSTRHAARMDVDVCADRDGKIHALRLNILADTGGYGEHAPDVTYVSGHNTFPIYNIPVLRFQRKAVYTNRVPAGAFRGFGAPQALFGIESAINQLAAELGMDPTVLREQNIIREGLTHPFLGGTKPGKPVTVRSCTLDKCIRRGKEMIGWDEKYPRRVVDGTCVRGVGMALASHGSGIAGSSTAVVDIRLNYAGDFTLLIGSADLGTGSDTILAQMAAQILDVSVENIQVYSADTDITPYDQGAYASCTTYITGNAVVRAAEKMKQTLLKTCAETHGQPLSTLRLEDGGFQNEDGSFSMSFADFAGGTCRPGGAQIAETATFTSTISPTPFMAGFAEVEVDMETGKLTLIHYAAAIDCGTVINHNLAKIQAEGGLMQGIGLAMTENVVYGERGNLCSNSLMQYNIPRRRDAHNIEVEFLPSYEPTGPFGAKSIGEIVLQTPPPAIADAVYNAVGVRICELPITPEKILRGLREKERKEAGGRASEPAKGA